MIHDCHPSKVLGWRYHTICPATELSTLAGSTPLSYYISAYAFFRLEAALRRRQIDSKYRPFKYHMLGIMRMHACGGSMPALGANQFERYITPLKEILWDDERCADLMQQTCGTLDALLGDDFDGDRAKDANLQRRAKRMIIGEPEAGGEA
jgi:hypothetical protein